jgi:nicotinate-nucleotide pyrophosphorylase (carboxylating)
LSLPDGSIPPLDPILYEPLVRRALEEDLGRAGDLTTDAVIPLEARGEARVVARSEGRVAGLAASLSAFRLLDDSVEIELRAADGEDVEAGETLAVVRGPLRPILSAERTALNLLGRLCGIATTTRGIVRAVEAVERSGAPPARVVCTRKTTPGLRALEKHAVRCGGGANHRFGLDDAVLIKDNHRAVAGGAAEAIRRARAHAGHLVKIEIEVDTLDQLDEALREGVDVVLLDNMSVDELTEAVRRVRAAGGHGSATLTEASGGITPETAPAIAATGVDLLAVGWISHSAPSLDVALDL